MTRKKLSMLLGSVCLAVILAVMLVPSCAQPAASPEVGSLEELAVAKARIAELEQENAKLKEPQKVYTGVFTTMASPYIEKHQLWLDSLKEASGGRLDFGEIVLEESLVPMDQGLVSLGKGMWQGGCLSPGYSKGVSPMLGALGEGIPVGFESLLDWLDQRDYGFRGLFEKEYAKFNAHFIDHNLIGFGNIMSNKPYTGLDDLKQMKVRGSGIILDIFEELGITGTVWLPGSEIYTSLATGLINAVQFSSAIDMYNMGIQEVTTHWETSPSLAGMCANGAFLVNMDLWESLPDDLKLIFTEITEACYIDADRLVNEANYEAIRMAEAEGIILVTFSDEDRDRWNAATLSCLDRLATEDAATAEGVELLKKWLRLKGIIE